MIHDINKSKSKFAIGFIVLLFFSCAFLVAYNFIYQINNINEQFKFDSEEAAIIDGVSKEANKIVLPEDLQKNIILSKEHNGSLYLLVKIPFSEYGMEKHYVYVAKVDKKKDKYRFEKTSNSISLNTLGDLKDVDYVPYATFFFDDIDGLFFVVGKVYDNQYKPYILGDLVPIQNGNIYATVQERKRPEIDVVK